MTHHPPQKMRVGFLFFTLHCGQNHHKKLRPATANYTTTYICNRVRFVMTTNNTFCTVRICPPCACALHPAKENCCRNIVRHNKTTQVYKTTTNQPQCKLHPPAPCAFACRVFAFVTVCLQKTVRFYRRM